jgi:hypothetical protein
MRFRFSASAFLLALAFGSAPATAQDVCLQNDRMQSLKVIDSQTILATDKVGKQYTIHMTAKCVGLNKFAQVLTFRPRTERACLQRGDTIGYSLPGDPAQGITVHGAQTQLGCTVDAVSAGAPPGSAS